MTSRETEMEKAYNDRLGEIEKKRRAENERRRQYEEAQAKRQQSLAAFFIDNGDFFSRKGFTTRASSDGRKYELMKKNRTVIAIYFDNEEKLKLDKSFVPGPSIEARSPDELVQPIAGALDGECLPDARLQHHARHPRGAVLLLPRRAVGGRHRECGAPDRPGFQGEHSASASGHRRRPGWGRRLCRVEQFPVGTGPFHARPQL